MFPETIKLPVPFKPHENLKSLFIKFRSQSMKSMDPIDILLKMFPNVENLLFCGRTYQKIRSNEIFLIAQHRLKMLQSMRISVFDEESVPISYPSLRKLTIGCVENADRLGQFLAVNRQLEELSIGIITDRCLSDDKPFELPSSMVNLRIITLLDTKLNFRRIENFLRILMKSCPNLLIQVDDNESVRVIKNIKNITAESSSIRIVKFELSLSHCLNEFSIIFCRSFDVEDWRDIDWNYLKPEIEEELEEESSSSESSDDSEADESTEDDFVYDSEESYPSDDNLEDADFEYDDSD